MTPPNDDSSTHRGRHAATTVRHRRMNRRKRRVVITGVAVALTALILASGVILGLNLTSERAPTSIATSSRDSAPTPQNAPSDTAALVPKPQSPFDSQTLESNFRELQTAIHGTIGVAVTPIGPPQAPVLLGNWTSGPAWSTMKVPLAIAALRADENAVADSSIRAAITQSDNAAAETIWETLGDPEIAASKVDAVLQETGDPTNVESQRVRPEYSPFGQTIWSLADQTRFLAAAVCDNRNAPIFDLMGEIESDQTWGLGTLADARFKGGWGPSEAGAYLVRQIGVLSVDAGQVAVAIAVQPESGSFADGTTDLSRIADWLSEHAGLLPAGTCTA